MKLKNQAIVKNQQNLPKVCSLKIAVKLSFISKSDKKKEKHKLSISIIKETISLQTLK